jgi:hypothetical protein
MEAESDAISNINESIIKTVLVREKMMTINGQAI